nr:immunoglobulin light chain junction region [Macaca mulatta]MOW67900.1 immunoglobulin light chain junction region [Macaca mulatta]MOW71844.1 immunoglobulin light chain junction region [Macaca mulatta]MOX16900.1 immunoglobulin light chain junction region [Macaca mulatta]MOX17622.1 immunoglobulin light chain junction region [Macaca mulatta]
DYYCQTWTTGIRVF